MEPKHFLPQKFIGLFSELHEVRNPKPQTFLYTVVLISVIALLTALPFLYIDVTISSPGILRPVTESASLLTTSVGIVRAIKVKENELVKKDQWLVNVYSPQIQERIRFLKQQCQDSRAFLDDVNHLLAYFSISRDSKFNIFSIPFQTHLYRQSLISYGQKLNEQETILNKAVREHNLNRKLYHENVISQIDYESFRFAEEQARNNLRGIVQSQLTTWQLERRELEKELSENEASLAQAEQDSASLQIKAPVSGSIQQLAGIYAGCQLQPNQNIAIISPETGLIAEILVSPQDIGLLNPGMIVRMQVNAYNYNLWGFATGTIKEIPGDVRWMKDQPVFEVRCDLDHDFLKTSNGYVGKFKKGMTLQARFVIARRSLWQLLHDKADDWLNPHLQPH